MENRIKVKIKQCYDTEENYKANNPVLLEGQLAYTKDKYGKYKIGDGVSHWNDLDYTENIFIGTQKEYEEKNAASEIKPGTVVYITDDRDYCNINIDKELSESSTNLIENQAVAKALKTNETKDNTATFDEAPDRENINTGEKHSTIFGKIKKWLHDLKDVAFSGSYNDLEDKPEIPPEVAVKGDAESKYRQGNVNLTAENIGALPLHDTSDSSLGIVNSFNTRSASLNIDFADEKFKNKITYMMATSSAEEGQPPLDSMVINLGWDTGAAGAQLAIGMYQEPVAYLRSFNNGSGGWTGHEWLEIITSAVIDKYLYLPNVFATRVASAQIDFSDKKYFNKLTYAIMTTTAKDDLPAGVTDGTVLNFGWDNSKYGKQVLFANTKTIWMRTSNAEGIYTEWTQVIGSGGSSGDGIKQIYATLDILNNADYETTFMVLDNVADVMSGYGNYFYVINFQGHKGTTGYGGQILMPYNGGNADSDLLIRTAIGSEWRPFRRLLHDNNYKKYAMPRAVEHDNEINFGSFKSTSKYVWFNYRDGISDGVSVVPIDQYVFGRGLMNTDTAQGNISSIRARNANLDGKVIPLQGTMIADMQATAGTAGYILFAKIKVIGTYANHPCTFVMGRRGSSHIWIVCVYYQSYNGIAPSLENFYQIGDYSAPAYIHNEGSGVWGLYLQKNEAYGEVYIWNAYIPPSKYIVTYPNTQVATLPSGYITASIGGTVWRSYRVADSSNHSDISFSYSLAGLAYSNYTYLAAWNGYQLRAVDKKQFMAEVSANGFWGMTAAGGTGTGDWVRTTQAGLIPYQSGAPGSGHSQLGTSTWYFAKTYSDEIYALRLYLGGTNYTDRVMEAFDDNDGTNNYGNELCIGGGGNVFIGSGESSYNLRTELRNSKSIGIESYGTSNENTYISSDGILCFFTNCNSIASRRGILMDVTGNLVPASANGQSLGSGGKPWSYLFATYLSLSHNPGSTISFQGFTLLQPGGYNNHFRIMASAGSVGSTNANKIGLEIHVYNSSTNFWLVPMANGQGYLGASDTRWNQIYSTNSAISTSDRNFKKEISYIGQNSGYDDTNMPDDILCAFIEGLKACIYKLIDGESGRPHHGFIAQDIEELLKKLGIKDHAAFIKSPKTKEVEVKKEIKKEDGTVEIVKELVQEEIPGEYIYSLRYEEFISDLTRYCQILYKKNEELENIQKEQEKKIQELETRLSDMETRLDKIFNAA